MRMSAELEAICEEEIHSLLRKKAIETVPDSELCFVSGLFVIPKRTGGYRPIVNMKILTNVSNTHKTHFKMEGIHVLKDIIRPLDFFTKIDLKDAYLTVPIFHEHKKISPDQVERGVIPVYLSLFWTSFGAVGLY